MNRHIKNAELMANLAIAELLKKGNVIVVEIADTANENFKTLFLAQIVKDLRANSGSVNSGQSILLGWQDRVIRATQNAGIAQANLLKEGDSLNEKFGANFTLVVKQSYEKVYPSQVARATSDGEALVCAKTGQAVYESTELTTVEEFKSHTLISSIPQSKYVPEGTTVSKILEGASV
jgi:hypothetical protein